jgi:hypothetical protein
MENLNPDFLDFITLLEKKSVEYLVVGGYAVGFHGFPRYTGDIDFFVAVSEMNARRLMEVFQVTLRPQDFSLPSEARHGIFPPFQN